MKVAKELEEEIRRAEDFIEGARDNIRHLQTRVKKARDFIERRKAKLRMLRRRKVE